MNIFRRLKNLWLLSEYIPGSKEIENNLDVGDKVAMIVKKKNLAKIVDLSEEVDLE